jgi:hypothetical protein
MFLDGYLHQLDGAPANPAQQLALRKIFQRFEIVRGALQHPRIRCFSQCIVVVLEGEAGTLTKIDRLLVCFVPHCHTRH